MKNRAKKRKAPLLEPLEPRLMMSADLPGMDILLHSHDTQDLDADSQAIIDNAQAHFENLQKNSLIVIDSNVPNYQELIDDIKSNTDADTNFNVLLLDADADGLTQISDALNEYENLDSIHIISHGDAGEITIGNTTLDAESTQENSELLSSWSTSLTEDADILIYGCDLASTSEGEALVDTLATLTGADIAASDDITGHKSLGGDWELEYERGDIETDVVVSLDMQDNYQEVLAETVYESNSANTNDFELKDQDPAGQTFKHTSGDGTYDVNRISIELYEDSSPSQTITVSLQDSWSGTVLGSATISSTDIAGSFTTYDFDFTDVALDDGVEYVIKLTTDGDGGVFFAVDDDASYSNGDMLDSDGEVDDGKDIAFSVNQFLDLYTVADDFESGDSTGNTGTVSWSRDWALSGDAVMVGGELQLKTTGTTADREADLSGATTASFSFDFRTEGGVDSDTGTHDSILVEVSSNGGTDWVTLEDIEYIDEATSGTNSGSLTYDISDYIATNTQVRFSVNAGYGSGSEYFYVDNLNITYSDSNSAPTFDDGNTLAVDVVENSNYVATPAVTDADGGDTLTYSINGGVDYNLFEINSSTGELRFITAPDFENPTDNNGYSPDGVYEVQIAISDGNGGVDTQDVSVTVTDDNNTLEILSKETTDLDGDGFIDAIHITFDKAIDDSTVVASDFDVAGVTGEAFVSTTNGDTADDSDIYITFNDGIFDTAAIPSANYTQGTLADLDGNLLASDSSTSTTDAASPIASITRDDADNTDASSVTFSVDFSEDVSNVDATDFSLNLTDVTANSTVIVGDAGDVDASTYTVTVDTIDGYGTLGLDIAGGTDIVDLVGNAVDTTPVTDEVYTITTPIENSLPSAQTTNEDTAIVFNTDNSNLISIIDADAGTDDINVTISVSNATLTLSTTTGLTFISGSDTSSSMTIQGTLSEINAALDGMSYTPTADYNGSDILTIHSSDSVYASLNIDTDLLGHYTFDNTSDLANDSSVAGSYDGVLNGNVATVDDATRGDVLSFDGDGDYVSFAHEFDSPANITLSTWVNSSTANADAITIGNDVILCIDDADNSNHVTALYYDGTDYHVAESSVSIVGDGWHHIALTFDDATKTLSVYIDGTLSAQDSFSSSIAYGSAESRLGGDPNGSHYFNGLMDDARIYDRALTAEEISTLANDSGLQDSDTLAITINAINDAPIDLSVSPIIHDIQNNDISVIASQTGSQDITATLNSGREVTVSVSEGNIYAQLSNADDSLIGSSFYVFGADDEDLDSAVNPIVAALPDGGFIIVAETSGYANSGDSGTVIQGMVFDADGNAIMVTPTVELRDAFLISHDTSGETSQINSTLDVAGDGTVTVSWNNESSGQFEERSFQILGPSVSEDASTGMVVASLTAVDPDAGETFTYSIVGDDSNFEIVGTELQVKDGATLDYETATSHSIVIRVTDANGLTYDETITLQVTNTNEAPTAINSTVSLTEDTPYVFTAADFNFSDVDGDALSSIKITALESVGYLHISGDQVTLDQVITKEDIDAGNLTFIPLPNENATGYDSFEFSVNDGTADSVSSYVMSMDVSAVNDSATFIFDPNLMENGSFEDGSTGWTGNSSLELRTNDAILTYGITATPDGVAYVEVENEPTDPDAGYIEQTVTTVAGQTYEFTLSAITRLNRNIDDMGSVSVNGVEIGTFTTGDTWADYSMSFTADSTSSVITITSLGSESGSKATAGDGAGLMVDNVRLIAVQPNPTFIENGSGVVLDADVEIFDAELSVADNFDGSTLTLVNNTGANADDKFSATGNLATLTEGGNLTLSGTIIGTVTTNSGGTLNLTFNANATQAAVNETMQSIAYENSSDTPPSSAQIDWTFNDGELDAVGSISVSITAVNDAPTSRDSTVAALEDSTFTFSATDFNFSDVDGDSLSGVKITALETIGSLQLSGSDVTLDQIITLADIDAGNLTYTPLANESGVKYDSFEFSVNDGVLDSTSTYLMSVGVSAVNDAPLAVDDTNTTDEDTVLSVVAPGVLSNDTDDSGLTSGSTLNYDAANDGDLTWNDDNSTGFDWTLDPSVSHTTTPTTALPGITSAYTFDGTAGGTMSSFTNLSNNPTENSASFELWFRPTDLTAPQILFETGGNTVGTSIYLDGNTLYFAAKSGIPDIVSIDLTTLLVDPTSEFIQVVSVIDFSTSQIELFVNGTSVGNITFTGSDWAGNNPTGLGQVNGNTAAGSGNFIGDIAIFRFYEQALNATEVQENYNAVATDGNYVSAVNGNSADVNSEITLASGALVTMNSDGSYDYDPNGAFESLSAGESTMDSFTYDISDGTTSSTATVTVTIDGVNDAPIIANGSDLTYGEGSGAAPFTTSTLSDSDSTDFDTGVLTFKVSSGADGGEELILVNISGVTTSGTNVLVDGVVVGVQAGGSSGVDFTVTFNSDATTARVEAVYQALSIGAYNDDDPTIGVRDLEVTISDGDGATSNVATAKADLTSVTNDLTLLDLDSDNSTATGNDFATTFTEGLGAVKVVDTDMTLSDVDNTDLTSILVTLTNELDGANKETLAADVTGTSLVATWDKATGVLTIDGTGTVEDYKTVLATVTYENTSNNPDTTQRIINIVANDGTYDSATATTTISIIRDDSDPVAVDDSFTVLEGSAANSLDLAVNDTDDDGDLDVNTIEIVSGPTNGSLVVNTDGTVTYTHDGSETTMDSFTYNIKDSLGVISNDATVSITVDAVNDAPTASDKTVSTNEDTDYVFAEVDFGFSDIESNTFTNLIIDTVPTTGTLFLDTNSDGVVDAGETLVASDVVTVADITAGKLIFRPLADENGTSYDSFTFKVQDDGGTADGGVDISESINTITIDVVAVDDVTVVVDDVATVDEDNAIYINVLANDTDPDTKSEVDTVTQGANGTVTINASDGFIKYDPNADFNGTDTFTYTNTEGNTGTVTVTINAVNDAPLFDSSATTTASENSAYTYNVVASDIDGDALGISATTLPAWLTFSDNGDGTATLTGTPVDTDVGDHSVVLDVSDSSLNATQSFTITVSADNSNAVPVVDNPVPNQTATSNSEFSFTFADNTFSDADGDTLTYSSDAGGWLSFDVATKTFSGTPTVSGTTTVTITADDGNGGTVTDTFDIVVDEEIVEEDYVPEAFSDRFSSDEDTTLSASLGSNDTLSEDGGNRWSVSTTPSYGSLSVNSDGTFTYTPDLNYHGSDSFTYSLIDADGDSSTATVSIEVISVEDAPVANQIGTQTTLEDELFAFTLPTDAFVDGDGDILTYSSDASGWLSFDKNTKTFSGTPENADVGTLSVTVSASDSTTMVIQSFDIVVQNVNDDPVSNADSDIELNEGDNFESIDILSNDTDIDVGDVLTVLNANASHGLVVVNTDGTLSYTPDSGYVGDDTISYTITDSNGGVASNALAVQIKSTFVPPDDKVISVPEILIDEINDSEDTLADILDETLENSETIENPIIKEEPYSDLETIDPKNEDEIKKVINEYEDESDTVVLEKDIVKKSIEPGYAKTTQQVKNNLEVSQRLMLLKPLEMSSDLSSVVTEHIQSKEFSVGLNEMYKDMDRSFQEENLRNDLRVEAAAGIGVSMSAGFVAWLLRSGSLVASFFTVMPIWNTFDPVSILSESDKIGVVDGADAEDLDEPSSKEDKAENIFDKAM